MEKEGLGIDLDELADQLLIQTLAGQSTDELVGRITDSIVDDIFIEHVPNDSLADAMTLTSEFIEWFISNTVPYGVPDNFNISVDRVILDKSRNTIEVIHS